MRKGICDNPNSYYFSTEVHDDFEPEECGLRRCGSCIYFVPYDSLDDYAQRELERERERLERLFGIP